MCALQTPVAEAAVALLFRSLECQPHLWLVWDNDSLAYGLLHMLAAFAAASNDGERRAWFRPGVDPRVGLAVFGPSAAVLHDVLHDLLKPPPVFLRPEISGTCVVLLCVYLFTLACPVYGVKPGLCRTEPSIADRMSALDRAASHRFVLSPLKC